MVRKDDPEAVEPGDVTDVSPHPRIAAGAAMQHDRKPMVS
jgi:hypothetical protein